METFYEVRKNIYEIGTKFPFQYKKLQLLFQIKTTNPGGDHTLPQKCECQLLSFLNCSIIHFNFSI